jgi:hypothetical protein
VHITPLTYSEAVTNVLRRKYGPLRHAAKLLGKAAGVSPRTSQNWLDGKCAPQGSALLNLMASCDDLSTEILKLIEKQKQCGSGRS